tara:strand:- start:40994 stop:41299 length:306 start_codon:yes stop_codon:yes gene_type:complete
MSYGQLMRYISSEKIAGVLPLDWVLHFFLGAIFTIILLKFRIRFLFVILTLAILEIIKEIFDFRSMTATYTEAILDFVVTMTFPVLLYVTRLIKEKVREDD